MTYLIGLDIGTSAVKAALLTQNGKIVKTVSRDFTYRIENGKYLLDPEAYCQNCFAAIRALTDTLKSDDRVAALCSCCASGNLVLLDENDQPILPIIGWQSRMPKEEYLPLFPGDEPEKFYRTVGWPLGGSFAPAWICALRNHEPAIVEKTKTVAMSAEYMNYQLTGKWGLSHSMGTPFFLIDQEAGEYSRPLLEKLGIADKKFPPIFEKGTVLGTVLPEKAEVLGVTPDTAVVLGSFDHPSGAMGAGVFREGEMLLSCGTSWVEFFPLPSRERALATGGLVDRFMIHGSPYCLMKSLSSVSQKIDRLRRLYFGDISLRDFDRLVDAGEPGCGGLSFTLEETEPTARPAYTDEQIARAIIESAAGMLKANLEQLQAIGLRVDKITAIGGITNSAECMRVLSQVLDREIAVVNGQSAGAVGSALLAGVGVGLFAGETEAFACMKAANG